MVKSIITRSREEEIANAVTHSIGILFSLLGIVLLAINASILPINRFAVVVFLFSMLLLYTASTLYHAMLDEKIKNKIRYFDHISIYFLIAGSYTPFLLLCVKGVLGWSFFYFIWSVALMGVLYKFIWWKRYPKLSLYFYLGMGWLVVFIVKPMYENLPTQSFFWLILGGVFYSLGTIFYAQKSKPYTHVIWHLFVLAGSISHYVAVMKIQ